MTLNYKYMLCLVAIFSATSCKKYLEIPLPVNTIAGSGAYASDNSTGAVLNGIYSSLSGSGYFDGAAGIGYYSGLYTDELQNMSTLPTQPSTIFYSNAVQSANTSAFWTSFYKQIYTVNLAIEGISPTTNLNFKNQWLGEAYFMRAWLHFYLVNLYGDVPLVTTSSYKTNQSLVRTPRADVYKQIIADLLQAKDLLTNEYHNVDGAVTTDRGRPNKLAATALLARVYLYTGSWADAQKQADTVIASTTYQLPAPASAFLASSKEPIWWLTPVSTYVKDYAAYNNAMPALLPAGKTVVSYGVNVVMNTPLVNAFETGDARLSSWVRSSVSSTTPAVTYYFPDKYKTNITGAENIVLLRLGEQYLIRAEARALQNNLTGANSAKSDLDVIRSRAGLAGTTATTQADMLKAIIHERQTELFSEEGHRFFDLRRTNTLDAVMGTVAPQKGTVWVSFMQWWPIPTADIFANPGLIQTPGYQ